jgi:hypothetical protein
VYKYLYLYCVSKKNLRELCCCPEISRILKFWIWSILPNFTYIQTEFVKHAPNQQSNAARMGLAPTPISLHPHPENSKPNLRRGAGHATQKSASTTPASSPGKRPPPPPPRPLIPSPTPRLQSVPSLALRAVAARAMAAPGRRRFRGAVLLLLLASVLVLYGGSPSQSRAFPTPPVGSFFPLNLSPSSGACGGVRFRQWRGKILARRV